MGFLIVRGRPGPRFSVDDTLGTAGPAAAASRLPSHLERDGVQPTNEATSSYRPESGKWRPWT